MLRALTTAAILAAFYCGLLKAQPPEKAATSNPTVNTTLNHTTRAETIDPPPVYGTDYWMEMGAGVPGKVLMLTTAGGTLFALYHGSITEQYFLSQWTGAQWQQLSQLPDTSFVRSIATYRGRVYILGAFKLHGGNRWHPVIYWDGAQWQTLPSAQMSIAFTACEFNGELYVGGYTNSRYSPEPGKSMFFRWDGRRAVSLPNNPDLFPSELSAGVISMAVFRGRLVISRPTRNFPDTTISGMCLWDGTSWASAQAEVQGAIKILHVYHNELYAVGDYNARFGRDHIRQLARWNGGTWKAVGQHRQWSDIIDLSTCRGLLCVLDDSPARNTIETWNGRTWDSLGDFSDQPTSVVEFENNLVVGGNFELARSTPRNHVARLCTRSECGAITGTIFHDLNSNAIIDPEDTLLAGRVVRITPGPMYATSDARGQFLHYAPPGSYKVELTPRLHWGQTSPANPTERHATVTEHGEISPSADFAVAQKPGNGDARLGIVGTLMRPGRRTDYFITVSNIGSSPMSGTVVLTYDAPFVILETSPTSLSARQGEIIWRVSDLAPGVTTTFQAGLNLTTAAQQDDLICAWAVITPDNDNDLIYELDDRDSVCEFVRNSHDPNDITVLPAGDGEVSRIAPTDSVLEYTIRFQNTGNDTAFNVLVVDTLSEFLDPESVILRATTHPCELSLGGKGVLQFVFTDIMLADSATNEPLSHGAFKYTVHLKHDLPQHALISNRALIYFDYNDAVVTNTTELMTGVRSSGLPNEPEPVQLRPNPSTGLVRIHGSFLKDAPIVVRNLQGLIVHSALPSSATNASLDLGMLPSALYLICIPTHTGINVEKVMIVR